MARRRAGAAVRLLAVRLRAVVHPLLVAQLATRVPYQKHFDPFALLVCLLALRRGDLRGRAAAAGAALVALLSALYVAAFAFGLVLPES